MHPECKRGHSLNQKGPLTVPTDGKGPVPGTQQSGHKNSTGTQGDYRGADPQANSMRFSHFLDFMMRPLSIDATPQGQ
jgi:hypothetical protein